MKMGIVGSRDFLDYDLLKLILNQYNITEIISGGARGADSLAEKYAKINSIPIKIFKPDWIKNGRSAGVLRNILIVDSSDIIIAFWDGLSRGTSSTINLCLKKKKTFRIVNFKEKNVKI